MSDKILTFNYIVESLIEWYKEENPKQTLGYKKAFTKLTLLKLLFLVSAISKKEEDISDLLDVFDDFYALPYGPVEIDIYNAINNNEIPDFEIDGNSLREKKEKSANYSSIDTERIYKNIKCLKEKNNRLINYSSSELVNLTHRWESWSNAYSFATFLGKLKMPMFVEDIKNDKHKAYDL